MDALLDRSAADRQQVIDAVNNVSACQSVGNAQTALTQAADHRAQLVTQLAALPLDQVAGGAEAVSNLSVAWQHSSAADRAFADWAASSVNCSPSSDLTQDGNYQRGVAESAQATQAKRDFLARWNAIAPTYGFRTRAENEI